MRFRIFLFSRKDNYTNKFIKNKLKSKGIVFLKIDNVLMF